MTKQDRYHIVKNLHVTEKSRVLQELKNAESNPSIRRCKAPKYVFIVDKEANKQEIAKAVQEMYREENIRVVSVNTIRLKPKKRRVRGKIGQRPARKKAIVTLQEGDSIEEL
ncbi:MAG: 50S ribosomal protein L23 [Waddliaceae bacterium]